MRVSATDLGSTMAQLVRQAAEAHGDRPLMRFEDGTVLTFRQVDALSARFARVLLARGARRGEVGLTWMPNCAEFVIAYFGFARIGMVNALVNVRYQADDLANAIAIADPEIVVFRAVRGHEDAGRRMEQAATVVPRLAEPGRIVSVDTASGMLGWDEFLAGPMATEDELRTAEEEVRPEDLLNIIYTSGTTGAAKGSLNRQGAVLKNSFDGGVMDRFDADTVFLLILPLFHCFSLRSLIAMMQYGGTMVVNDPFEPEAVLDLVEQHRVNHTYCVPAQLVRLIDAYRSGGRRQDLSSWTHGLVAGAAIPQDLREGIEHVLGVGSMANAFGITEGTAAVTQTLPEWSLEQRFESVGLPIPDLEIGILDPDGSGARLPVGETGELCLRGYSVHAGYYRSEHRIVDEAGFLHTGDAARLREDGTLEIMGRYKEMYKSNGLNVYPKEVEEVLNGHPGVLESAVVGVPDAVRGEVGVAFVRPAVGPGDVPDEAALIAYLSERIARFKCPVRVELVEGDFPRSFATQKVQKEVLKVRASELLAS